MLRAAPTIDDVSAAFMFHVAHVDVDADLDDDDDAHLHVTCQDVGRAEARKNNMHTALLTASFLGCSFLIANSKFGHTNNSYHYCHCSYYTDLSSIQLIGRLLLLLLLWAESLLLLL